MLILEFSLYLRTLSSLELAMSAEPHARRSPRKRARNIGKPVSHPRDFSSRRGESFLFSAEHRELGPKRRNILPQSRFRGVLHGFGELRRRLGGWFSPVRFGPGGHPMTQRKGNTMSIDKQQRDAEWTRHYGLAMHILREGMHFEDGSVPPALEDLIADAMAHAWVRFEQLCDKRPDAPAKSRVRWAAKTGVLRVKSRRRFVRTRQHGYVDALDHRSADELLDAQDKPVTGYRDPSDFSNAEAIIAGLPEQLKPIARLFSFGRSKADVSRVREIH